MNKEIPFVSSPSNPRVKELAGIKPGPNAFLVEGFHLVGMASESKMLDEVYFSGESLPEGLSYCKATKTTYEIIKKLSLSKTPEPILGVCHYQKPRKTDLKRSVVLDRVQDPGNVGAILRSCLAFGFRDVFFLPGTCSPFNPKALASSQGGIFGLNLHFLPGEEDLLSLAKEKGISLFSTALRDSLPLETFPFNKEERLAFIFGNEGKGVSESLLSCSKARLRIAMEGIESLNVSVAAGILLYSVYAL